MHEDMNDRVVSKKNQRNGLSKIFVVIAIIVLIIITAIIIWFVANNSQTRFRQSNNPVVQGYQKQALKLQQTVEQSPQDPVARLDYARALYGAEEKSAALEEFLVAATLNPDNPSIYKSIGNIYRDLEKYDKAEDAYRKQVELSPKDKGAYMDLANLQVYQLKVPMSGIETYKKALENTKGGNDIKLLMALAYEQANEYGKARALYEQIIKSDPSFVPAKNNLKRLDAR